MQQTNTWTIGKKLYLTFAILLTIKAIPFVGGVINYSVATAGEFNIMGIIFNLAGIGLAIGVLSRVKEDGLIKTGAIIGIISLIIALISIAVYGIMASVIASTELYYNVDDSAYFTIGIFAILGMCLSFVSWVVTVVATIFSYINVFKKPETDDYLYVSPQQQTNTTTNVNNEVVGVGFNAQDIYPKEPVASVIEEATISSNDTINVNGSQAAPIVAQTTTVAQTSIANQVIGESVPAIEKTTLSSSNTVNVTEVQVTPVVEQVAPIIQTSLTNSSVELVTPRVDESVLVTSSINTNSGYVTQITNDMLAGLNTPKLEPAVTPITSQLGTDEVIEAEEALAEEEIIVEDAIKTDENSTEENNKAITVITADMLDDE